MAVAHYQSGDKSNIGSVLATLHTPDLQIDPNYPKITNITSYTCSAATTGTTRDITAMELIQGRIYSEEAASKFMCQKDNEDPLDVL